MDTSEMTRGTLLKVKMTVEEVGVQQLADELRTTQATVSRWRGGRLPREPQLQALADRLGWSDAELGAYVRAPQ